MASPENPTAHTAELFENVNNSLNLGEADKSAAFDDCLNWVTWPSDTDAEVASLDTSEKHKSLETMDMKQVTDCPARLPQDIESKETSIQVAGRSISSSLARDEDQVRKPRGRPRKGAPNYTERPSPRKKARRDTAARSLEARIQPPMSDTVGPGFGLQTSMPGVHQGIAALPGGGRDSRSPEEARFGLESDIFRDLEGETPLGDPVINSLLRILADLAPYTVTLMSSLAHNAPVSSQSRTLDPIHGMNSKPITLIPIHTAEPEASWLLAVLDSNAVRVLDAMPAENHIGIAAESIKALIYDQPTLLKPITNEDCVPRAKNANTGVSVVIYAIHAIMESCGVEMDISSSVDFALWRAVMLRILKAASSNDHDISWDDDFEPYTVSLQGGKTNSLWSPGSSSDLFTVHYDMAKEEINIQLQYLQKQLGDLESAKRDRDEARARELRMLQSICGILTNLMEATAQQAKDLTKKTGSYEECLNILTKVSLGEQEQRIIDDLRQCLKRVHVYQSRRDKAVDAMSRVIQGLDQRIKKFQTWIG